MLSADCTYHIDRDNTVLWCNDLCHPLMHRAIGGKLEDAFPGILDVMQDVYNEAWMLGIACRVVFYKGVLAYTIAHNLGDYLEVGFQRVPIIGLREALDAADEWLSSGHSPVA